MSARRPVAISLIVGGVLLLSFAGARYAAGALKADRVRQRWDEIAAQRVIALTRSSLATHDRMPIATGTPVSRLVIPRIDLDEIVVEGVGENELNAGPGHVPGSAVPGERGNAIVSAHRDRHFNRFDDLRVGDTIKTESGFRSTTWIVVSRRVIDKDAPALFQRRDTMLTLTTCWPIRYLGTAPDRLIITAKPLELPPKRS